MGKLSQKLLVFLFMSAIFSSCIVEDVVDSTCWLADPDISCRYDKVNSEYYMDYNETKTIYLCWSGAMIPIKATCSFNGSNLVDVSAKSMNDRYTQFIISPSIKEGVNTFDIYYGDTHERLIIMVYKKK